ncbi:MAG TPA: peptide ABC transporter ATP-binding protein [Clostridiales bacterium]|nr:peptide ABC transporter ATP-binding protein [Clostridiales bacterium]
MGFLEIINVDKIYNNDKKDVAKVIALQSINLKIESGEMIAVVGKSGSGKSTLLHILGCLDTPTSGDYFIQADSVKNKKDKELARLRNKFFGFVLQDFGLIEHLTVEDNITVPLAFSSNKKRHKSMCSDILERTGMTQLRKQYVFKLSGGERQRVAIARALINDPDIILADEPTGSLDSENGKNIMEIFTELNKEGKTIVMVTHDQEVAAYCHKKIVISDGKIT